VDDTDNNMDSKKSNIDSVTSDKIYSNAAREEDDEAVEDEDGAEHEQDK
jgi:hypothetical protein